MKPFFLGSALICARLIPMFVLLLLIHLLLRGKNRHFPRGRVCVGTHRISRERLCRSRTYSNLHDGVPPRAHVGRVRGTLWHTSATPASAGRPSSPRVQPFLVPQAVVINPWFSNPQPFSHAGPAYYFQSFAFFCVSRHFSFVVAEITFSVPCAPETL